MKNYNFSAEVEKIFRLMIHSIYENKDIFLRELISNASDACDKMRHYNLQNNIASNEEFKISITLDSKNKIISIADNGIGMTEQELIENLGTIAKSGTQKFLDNLSGDAKKDSSLIGQFGVGFYASFMVADNVTVISKSQNSEKAYLWHSDGSGSFSVDETSSDIKHGTIVTLKIKDEEKEYLDIHKLKFIAKTYSNHIDFKITFSDVNAENNLEETLNDGKAIWLKNKSEISEEEYQAFYKSVAFLGDDKPFMTLHNKAEGLINYTSLLFVPSIKPFDLYHPDRLVRTKLYIKRVLISEKVEIVPQFLRFLRGVIDSDDLPLNLSRETVQNTGGVAKIKSAITKKILKDFVKKLEKERDHYIKFWGLFGAVLKEGLCDGLEPRDEILEACLFQSSASDNLTTLKEYKSRMKEGQKSIYYIIADDKNSAMNNPQIEGFKSRGFEVLLLTDNVDDFWTNVLFEYDKTPFKSITKAGDELEGANNFDDKNDEKREEKTEIKPLLDFIKNTLGDKIAEVRITNKLAESPACLTVPAGGLEIRMERFLVENKQLPDYSPKIFEINENHKIIKTLSRKINGSDEDKKSASNIVKLLHAETCVIEGEPIRDAKSFADILNGLIERSL
jgi:molecular chaperone HtpG